MELRLMQILRAVLILFFYVTTVSGGDRDLEFCGTWRHGLDPLTLNIDLTTGCDKIKISANKTSLSVAGKITTQCVRFDTIRLNHLQEPKIESKFCLHWKPLLDQLWLEIEGEQLPLCWPTSLEDYCCTQLSDGTRAPEDVYGILDASIRGDPTTKDTLTAYEFNGTFLNCRKEYCDKENYGSTHGNQVGKNVARHQDEGNAGNPCARSTVVDMKDDVKGYEVTLNAPDDVLPESVPSIYLPPTLKQAAKNTTQVVCTYFKNNSLFQDYQKNGKILDDVVGITMENEVIADLSEPIRIGFHHEPKSHSRKCVSWDTKKDPLKVNWLVDGCETRMKGPKQTECLCNHLTYFTVLVELDQGPRPVRHLLALTAITYLGCAVSLLSCIVLIVYLCRKSKRFKEMSTPIHLGLAVSLAILYALFFFTGVLANVGGEKVCIWVGAGLHYALLSSLIWMGIEVFHTFWLVHVIFSPSPQPWIWLVIGFVLPAFPVTVLVSVGDIYGEKMLVPSEDIANPYRMCGMKYNNKALLAHYCTTVMVVAILFLSGLVMLFLVYRQIRTRDEWKQKKVAFLSIWGLSCLFGTMWGLAFAIIGPFTDFIRFVSVILTSFQGFLLMLRFYLLDWMRRKTGGSGLGSSSSGSTRQHMLQAQEKS
ncbi:adhesion G-protein coupled receptor G5-like [Sphaeramia orbicularis]|uniref:Adhesion G-protein coupled receptor G5-like n=1 Tax=Sphaeramia orbicularis TaxID=375764 RepID=A0A672YKY1_9TELE|nr:adhesion G-protein coupled receptor G5-like [Sphaeramia orbicularis]